MTAEDLTKLADVALRGYALIKQIIETVHDAHDGKVTPDEALSRLSDLSEKFAKAKDALHTKFDASER